MTVSGDPSSYSHITIVIEQQARVTIDRLEDHAVVGLLMKDEVPLGYGEEALHEKGVESQVMRFYCPSASR